MTLDDDDLSVQEPDRSSWGILTLPTLEDLEALVIESVILDPGRYRSVRGRLDPGDFLVRSHRRIWEALDLVVAAGEPIDAVSIWHRWQQIEQGKAEQADLVRVLSSGGLSANAEYYAGRVQEAAARRRLEALGATVGTAAAVKHRSMGEIVAGAEAALLEIQQRMGGADSVAMSDLVSREVAAYQASFEEGAVPGVTTGIQALDREIKSLPNGSVTVVGARPSMGKSSLVSGIAAHVAAHHGPVMYFPIETMDAQLTMNMIAQFSGVPAETITERRPMTDLDFEKYLKAAERVNLLPIWVDGTARLKPKQAWGRAASLQSRHGLALVVVDYLQLLEPEQKFGMNREQQVASISRDLRAMAGSLRVPVLACAQLRRAAEDSEDKRPRLRDLRESGQIEQDADLVMLLHRDEWYMPEVPSVQGWAEISVAKRKVGRSGVTVHLGFDAPCLKFYDRAKEA
jgi:replicative DNA helicase